MIKINAYIRRGLNKLNLNLKPSTIDGDDKKIYENNEPFRLCWGCETLFEIDNVTSNDDDDDDKPLAITSYLNTCATYNTARTDKYTHKSNVIRSHHFLLTTHNCLPHREYIKMY